MPSETTLSMSHWLPYKAASKAVRTWQGLTIEAKMSHAQFVTFLDKVNIYYEVVQSETT